MAWPMGANEERAFARPDLVQIIRFALVGAGRTALSLGLYLVLILAAHYWVAFTISFAIAVTLSAIATGRYVFFVAPTWPKYFLYAGVYLFNYLTSLALLVLAVELLSVPEFIAPIPVVLCMFPVNFLAERYVLRSSAHKHSP